MGIDYSRREQRVAHCDPRARFGGLQRVAWAGRRTARIVMGLVLALACVPMPASGFSVLGFTPTDFEWSTWPPYCRARYDASAAGSNSKFKGRIPPAQVEEWERTLSDVWYGLHHYCAAIVVFERARVAAKSQSRTNEMEIVIAETNYTLQRAESSHPMYSKMLTLVARANFELDRRQEAFDILNKAIALHPDIPDAYAAFGVLLRRLDRREDARDVLARGVEHVEGNAELHYLLGLIQFELGDYVASHEQAKRAYRLGYPLPGLKRKLKAAGHWQ